MKYTVCICETISQEFEIDAVDAEQALKIAEESYKSGKLVVEDPHLVSTEISITRPEHEATDWLTIRR